MDRQQKLQYLIDEKFEGNAASFSRAIQRSPSQVHHWLKGIRSLGDAGARHIEMTLNLPQGWFNLNSKTIENNAEFIESDVSSNFIKFDVLEIDIICKSHELDKLFTSFYMSKNTAVELFGNSDFSNIKLYAPTDNGMEGTVPKESMVFIDISIKEFIGDGVYLFKFQNKPYFRRLVSTKGDVIKVAADNVMFHIGNFDILPNEIEHLQIIGKAKKALPLNYINI